VSFSCVGIFHKKSSRQDRLGATICCSSGRLALAAAHAVSGNRTEASAILSDLANLPEQYVDWPVHLAKQYASLGKKHLAMAWLEKAYTEHSYALLEIRCAREFDVLQSDPRFQDLLRRMNFPQ
jgi:hypothetical protein